LPLPIVDERLRRRAPSPPRRARAFHAAIVPGHEAVLALVHAQHEDVAVSFEVDHRQLR
jgi:hypothetical protein